MNKYLIFDMDGTIVDFYGVPDWQHYLDDLQNAYPYIHAKPFYDMKLLNKVIDTYRKDGWKIIVISWLARVNKRQGFHDDIRKAKLDWLRKYNFKYDEIYFTEYGVNKWDTVSHLEGTKVLIDDSEEVRNSWKGISIDASQNILNILMSSILTEKE